MTTLRQLLFSAGTAAAVLLGAAAPAAAHDPTAPAARGTNAEETCYIVIDTGYERCFSNFADMTATISGGQVVLNAASDLTKATAAEIGAAARTVPRLTGKAAAPVPVTLLGVVYDDVGYRGSLKQFLGTSGDCVGGTWYPFNRMPSGWDNRVSSFESTSHCWITLYEDENRGGGSYGPLDHASIGALSMNDKASSIKFE